MFTDHIKLIPSRPQEGVLASFTLDVDKIYVDWGGKLRVKFVPTKDWDDFEDAVADGHSPLVKYEVELNGKTYHGEGNSVLYQSEVILKDIPKSEARRVTSMLKVTIANLEGKLAGKVTKYKGFEIIDMRGENTSAGDKQHFWTMFPYPHSYIDFPTMSAVKEKIDHYIKKNGPIKTAVAEFGDVLSDKEIKKMDEEDAHGDVPGSKKDWMGKMVFIHKHGDLDEVLKGGDLLTRGECKKVVGAVLVVKCMKAVPEGHVFVGVTGKKDGVMNGYVSKFDSGYAYIVSMGSEWLK